MRITLQSIIRVVEVGEAQFLTRLVPLAVAIFVVAAVYNFVLFRGLDEPQSMDNAQLARQIVRGEGYTTRFLRPQAVVDLRNHATARSLETGAPAELFPPAQFPPGVPRILPDTYNAPGYPYLLATWFYMVRPQFDQAVSPQLDGFINPRKGNTTPIYSGDRWIPLLNLSFVLLTGVLVYFMGRRLFDDRVAWLAAVSFFATDLVWKYSVTGISTSFLMFLVTAMCFCILEIFCISENCFNSEEQSFALAWLWGILLSLLLLAICLTRLHLLVLLVPLLVLLLLMPRPSWGIFLVIFLVVVGGVLPWFWHMYKVSGNPLGSNALLLIYGADGYKENQIFCTTSIPIYDRILRNLSAKEFDGFLWHFEQGWRLLGSNPLVILFVVSLMHGYKRGRAQMFQWFLVGTSLLMIAANNCGVPKPDPVGAWNVVVILLPGMLVVGSAFFFIQLDRLNLQVWLLNNLIVTALLALTVTPLCIALTTSSNFYYAFPPYMPPLIKILGGYARQDEWVTTDIPWASAWYANRASLWLPDSVPDFVSFNDNLCPTGVLFFTPETWAKSAATIMTGEEKDWLPFMIENQHPLASGDPNIPPNFPLPVHTATPRGGPDYRIWSDRPRWQGQ